MKFLVTCRTRISQILGLAFVVLFLVSGKPLEMAAPMLTGILFFLGCLLVGLATAGRMWCAQYIAGYKDGVLVREGPYSVCRNPLYFFSFLGCAGVGLCTESLSLAAMLIMGFAVIYPVIIRSEEQKLLRLFGKPYEEYLADVPRFIPDRSLYHEPKEYTVKPKVFRKAAFDVLWFIGVVGILECLEAIQSTGVIPQLLQLY